MIKFDDNLVRIDQYSVGTNSVKNHKKSSEITRINEFTERFNDKNKPILSGQRFAKFSSLEPLDFFYENRTLRIC
jgi:hypothetical protein